MTKVVWSAPALRDTLRIFDGLKDIDPVAARRVVDAIEASVDRLEDFPFSAPAIGTGRIRKLCVPRYPYVVSYRVKPRAVNITRVRSAHEDWLPR